LKRAARGGILSDSRPIVIKIFLPIFFSLQKSGQKRKVGEDIKTQTKKEFPRNEQRPTASANFYRAATFYTYNSVQGQQSSPDDSQTATAISESKKPDLTQRLCLTQRL
jgi:hypothetical protein